MRGLILKELIELVKLVLDVAHNEYPHADTGCSGFGLTEDGISLDICRRVKPLLEFNGVGVVLTRNGPYVLNGKNSVNESLTARVGIAESEKADLFLSVHLNAFDGKATGTETYIIGTGGKAEVFAKLIQSKVSTIFGDRGVKVKNLYVLKYTSMPAALLEVGFLDSQIDNAKLSNANTRQKIAELIADSVCQYFQTAFKLPGVVSVPPVVKDNKGEAITLLHKAIELLEGK